ncbi:MAG: hypothetical protein NUW23_10045 [Firmicutes bacterium]|nr:hypothetical protein [Bacillota bacterium]
MNGPSRTNGLGRANLPRQPNRSGCARAEGCGPRRWKTTCAAPVVLAAIYALGGSSGESSHSKYLVAALIVFGLNALTIMLNRRG